MNSSNKRTLISAISGILTAGAVIASTAASLVPPITSHSFYGWGATKVTDASPAGAPAKPVITITSSAAAAKPWDQGAGAGLLAPVTAGEKLTATFYIKAVSPGSVQTDFSFEKATAPYKSSVRQAITAGKSWTKQTIPFTSAIALPAKDVHILFHTGYAKGSFEVAGLTLTSGK